MGDARADLLVEQGMIPLEVHEDLRTDDPGEASDVVLAGHALQPDVALPEIGERVVHDELQSLVEREVEFLLQLLEVPACRLGGVARDVSPLLVEEHLHVLEPVLLPEEFLVLHPVLAVLLL